MSKESIAKRIQLERISPYLYWVADMLREQPSVGLKFAKEPLLTDEQKANLSLLLKKNPWTCPHCQTVGYNKGAGNRWHFDNCKEK